MASLQHLLGLTLLIGGTLVASNHVNPAGNKPTILEHRLEWATTTLSADCSTMNLHIRYNCTADPDFPFISDAEFRRVCDELVPEGFMRYYQQPITLGNTATYAMSITTEQTNELNQWIILRKNPDNNCVGKSFNDVIIPIIAHYCDDVQFSFNSVVIPIVGYYCDDVQFRYTIAHELGHGILLASEGITHSATHKGTSTLDSVPRNDSKIASCDGNEVFDLMHYFIDYEENCKVDGIRGAPFYLSALGAEADYQALTLRALEVLQEAPGACGLNLGTECTSTADCLQGLICEGNFCQECLVDLDCLGDQFCLTTDNPGGHLMQCVDRRPIGSLCDYDDMCEEGNCDLATNECQLPRIKYI